MKNSVARKLKQIPERYLTIGIDPHKKKHAAVAITEDLMVRTKFKFVNSKAGFEWMLENAKAEMIKNECRGIIFAIETGGHYWRNFAYFLEEKGVPFRLISQFTLKRMRDGRDKNGFQDVAELLSNFLSHIAEGVGTPGSLPSVRYGRRTSYVILLLMPLRMNQRAAAFILSWRLSAITLFLTSRSSILPICMPRPLPTGCLADKKRVIAIIAPPISGSLPTPKTMMTISRISPISIGPIQNGMVTSLLPWYQS
jgi:hypothetical protein